MADNYLNNTGLRYYHDRIKTLFAAQDDLDALDAKVDEIVAEGGEPNVIEAVKVNGVALTPTDKAVDVPVPTATSGITNDGDGESPFATEEYVGLNGGKIDVIKVNGTAQTIANKAVDIAVPTDNASLANGAGYQTASNVSDAIAAALGGADPYTKESDVQALIDAELADITGIDFQVVDSLPASGEHGVIYLLHKSGASGDLYDEYIWVTPASGTAHFEKIGTTEVDLSGYWATSDLTAITTAQIDTLFA